MLFTAPIISLLIGFVSSIGQSFIGYFKDKQDHKNKLELAALDHQHELKMAQLQVQNAKENRAVKLEEIKLNTELAGLEARLTSAKVGNVWVDSLNQITKTFIAVTLTLMYCMINYIYYQMLKDVASPAVFADLMWTEADQCLMNAIIGYYFGYTMSSRRKG